MPSGESDHTGSESLLRAVLDSMSESVVAIGETGVIEFVNRQSEEMFGYSAAELSGLPVERLIPQRFQANHREFAVEYLKRDGQSPSQMRRVWGVDRQGCEFPIDIHLNRARLADGRRIGIAILTDLREPDRLRKQREDFFRVAPDLLATLSPEGLLEDVNPAFTKVLGWSATELKSRSLSSLSDPEGRDVAERSVRAFLAAESAEGQAFEIRCVCRDGGTRVVSWALHTTEPGTRIAAGRDVTKSRQLAAERRQLAALVEDAPMLMAILSTTAGLTVQHLNPAGRELLGLTSSEPLPATDFRQLFGLSAVAAHQIEDALERDCKWSGSVEIVHSHDFNPIPVDLDIVGIADGARDPNPSPLAWGVFARDTRERQRDRELLEESEERFRTLLGQSTDPLFVHDETGRIIEVNRQACQDLGYSREELLRMSVFDIESLNTPAQLLELWSSMIPGKPITAPGRLHCKNGAFIPIDARVGVCILRGKPLYLAQTRDMTIHLRDEERLRALTAQLMTAREEERRQIALELHDDFTQKLAVIGMEIDLLRRSPDCHAGQEASATLERIRSSIISITDQMRELSHQYHPGMLEHAGLESAAAAHCQDVSRYSGIPVSLHVRDLPDRLPLEISLTLYRILQEALRNVVRHSGSDAAHVFVTGLTDPPRVVLAVVDHGKGFLIEDIRDGSGLGLLGIEERTRLVRGVLRLSSIPGEGTRLEVEIPLPAPR